MTCEPQLTVSDLAAIARCERQAVFDREYRARRSAEWVNAAQAGRRAHGAYQRRVALGAGVRDHRCFIASAVFGPDATETDQLREFRDQTLSKTRLGRAAIDLYYQVSPLLAVSLVRNPPLAAVARIVLRIVLFHLVGRRQ